MTKDQERANLELLLAEARELNAQTRELRVVIVDAPHRSSCCDAAVSVDEYGVTYCKRCYEAL